MTASGLIGSWTSVSAGGFAVVDGGGDLSTGRGGSGMNYGFHSDGTYVYSAFFEIVVTSTTIGIYEAGAFTVNLDTLTLVPTSKTYRRNGLDEGDALTTREFTFRLEEEGGAGPARLIFVEPASETVFFKG